MILLIIIDILMIINRFVRAQFMRGIVKHWPLDPLVLGAFAGFHAYQVLITELYLYNIFHYFHESK